jgi:hypothetical protein
MARRPSVRAGGGASPQSSVLAPPLQPSPGISASGGTGAQHNPIYLDSSAEYVAVRKSDLRELSTFGWLQEGAGAVGMFFVSGAFWLAITLVVEHAPELSKYWPAFVLCLLSILFGGVLLWISHRHFQMRDARINDYFRRAGTGSTTSTHHVWDSARCRANSS